MLKKWKVNIQTFCVKDISSGKCNPSKSSIRITGYWAWAGQRTQVSGSRPVPGLSGQALPMF